MDFINRMFGWTGYFFGVLLAIFICFIISKNVVDSVISWYGFLFGL